MSTFNSKITNASSRISVQMVKLLPKRETQASQLTQIMISKLNEIQHFVTQMTKISQQPPSKEVLNDEINSLWGDAALEVPRILNKNEDKTYAIKIIKLIQTTFDELKNISSETNSNITNQQQNVKLDKTPEPKTANKEYESDSDTYLSKDIFSETKLS